MKKYFPLKFSNLEFTNPQKRVLQIFTSLFSTLIMSQRKIKLFPYLQKDRENKNLWKFSIAHFHTS